MKRRWYWRQKGKGIKNNVIKNTVKYDDYKKALLEIKQRRHTIKAKQSKSHNYEKVWNQEISFSCFDETRCTLHEGTKTLVYSHKDTKEIKAKVNTVKPRNSGHLRVLENLVVIERFPLLGGNLRKIVTFGT